MSDNTLIDNLLDAVPYMAPSNMSLEAWRNVQANAVAFAGLTSRPPVPDSEDFRRVAALPRRRQVELGVNPVTNALSFEAQALVEIMNERLRRPDWQRTDCKCESMGRRCIKSLQAPQAWALYEAPLVGGIIGHLAVGSGKTALNFLMPMVMGDCKQVVLLIPSNLLKQLVNEYRLWKEHWRVPRMMWGLHQGEMLPEIKDKLPVIHVVPYSKLSVATSTKLLKDLNPDLLIADECQRLKNLESARTSRFVKLFTENDHPLRFCGWSGTVTSTGLSDYAHLAAFALREGSPLPIDPKEVLNWSLCIDPSDRPAAAGVLRNFCAPNETTNEGFRRRILETWGMVATKAGAVEMSLLLDERVPPPLPNDLQKKLTVLRTEWLRPDGEELIDALEVAAAARQLACGFFYRWVFPKMPKDPMTGKLTKESEAIIDDWFEKRKAWRKELRTKLKNREDHLDSELLCTQAAMRGCQVPPYEGELPVWNAKNWTAWERVKDKVEHETEAVWVDDYLVNDCVDWGKKHKGIIWYQHDAFGERVAKYSGLSLHRGGPNAEKEILAEKGDRSIVASISSNSTGRDGLQRVFHKQLIANPPSSGEVWEQCLDAQTEILTERGWLNINDSVTADDRVAAYTIDDGSIHWSKGKRVERRLGTEAMYGIASPHLDVRVTAGHRMVYKQRKVATLGRPSHDGEWEFRQASALSPMGRIPIAGLQESRGVPLTDAELMFIGLFMTDGNLSPGNNAISLFQSERYPQVMQLIEMVLNNCGFRYGHSSHSRASNFGPRKFPLHRWAISHGMPKKVSERHLRGWGALAPYIDKELPHTLDDMTVEQLRSLLFGMWAGDGSKTAGTYEYDKYEPGTTTIATKRQVTADRLQSLCVRRGLRCNVAKSGSVWKLYISEDRSWTLRTRKQTTEDRPAWTLQPALPSERVWCMEVDSGAIITRRNGKVAIVGNCLGRLHRLGQEAETVETYVYRHTEEMAAAIDRAVMQAKYVNETIGSNQKLLVCSCTFALENKL